MLWFLFGDGIFGSESGVFSGELGDLNLSGGNDVHYKTSQLRGRRLVQSRRKLQHVDDDGIDVFHLPILGYHHDCVLLRSPNG